MKNVTQEEIVNFCKQYGFIFQGSEIYGGLANTWDYGPMGRELKENLRRAWWKKFVQENPYNYGLDSAILMNPETWVASGHVTNFNDPLVDCKACKARHRADKLIENFTNGEETGDGWSNEALEEFIASKGITCPKCGKQDFTPIRKFNLLFETHMGVTEDSKSKVYLRGETAQGIFVNFLNVQRSMRLKVPFGICQTGKSFRNEITPGNFIFRTREFEQMELEFFCKPGEDLDWFGYWKNFCLDFLKSLGIQKENLRYRDHAKEELSFYSKATTDIEYKFPMGWGELWGIADRTDYDLGVHMEHSKTDMRYLDPDTNEKYKGILAQCDIVGPIIANKIREDKERDTLAVALYNSSIKTVSEFIENKEYLRAVKLYAEMTNGLIEYYNINRKATIEEINTMNIETSGHGRFQKRLA